MYFGNGVYVMECSAELCAGGEGSHEWYHVLMVCVFYFGGCRCVFFLYIFNFLFIVCFVVVCGGFIFDGWFR